MKYTYLLLSTLILFTACTKEESDENGTGDGITIGGNCRVNKVLLVDSTSGEGLYSLYSPFNADGRATSVQAYDSIQLSSDLDVDLVYSGDTVRPANNAYFILDAQGRITKFWLYEDATGTRFDTVVMSYTYDAGGYLVQKNVSFGTITESFFRYTYTWQGGNLVAIDGSWAVPGITQKVLTATLEYDASLTVKNFIPVMPDAFEVNYFQLALSLGTPSRNLVRSCTLTLFDEFGQPEDEYVNNFRNPEFSQDGYLLALTMDGENPGGLPFEEGRSTFRYYCR